jgi:hypothetical protein
MIKFNRRERERKTKQIIEKCKSLHTKGKLKKQGTKMRRSLDEGGSGRSMAQCGFVGDRIGIGRRGWTWTWVGGSGNGVASIENHLLISASKD